MIKLISCGKGQIEKEVHASLYLDCRIMWNPYRDPVLGGLTGDDPKMQDWVREKNANVVQLFLGLILQGLDTKKTRNSGKDSSQPFVVCTFCLAGVHRSRSMKHVLAQALKKMGYEVTVG